MVDTIIVDEVGKVRIPTEIEGALSEDDLFISDKAIEMIQEIRKQNNVPEDYFLRIATRGGGCSGMNYALGFDNEFDEQNDRKFFGQRLKSALKVLGLKGVNVAKDLGVAENTVSQWFQGKREPKFEVLKFLYQKYGINPLYVITGEGPPVLPRGESARLHALLPQKKTSPARTRSS